MLLSVTHLKHAPIFEKCVVGCRSKTGHPKGQWTFGLCDDILFTVLVLMVNILGEGSYMTNCCNGVYFGYMS